MEYLKIKWINKPTVKNTNKSLPKQTNLKTKKTKTSKKGKYEKQIFELFQ